MSIVDNLKDKLNKSFNKLGADASPQLKIHEFLNKKSVLRSTHFIISTDLCEPWQIEDFSLALPQLEYESVGTHENLYTFPVLKNNDPVKLTLTMADDEDGNLYSKLMELKVWTFFGSRIDETKDIEAFAGRYLPPTDVKNNMFNISIYKPDGKSIATIITMQNAFMTNFEDIKYSYSNLTDYQKYSVTFIVDPVDVHITTNLVKE